MDFITSVTAIEKGEAYLSIIDRAIKKYYLNWQADMNSCKDVHCRT